ncbi:putative 50S ribosomal subunit protein L5 [Candidatus Zinderia insecticola CARI]|uniref:Large ribosomal subunit protein uL5 n=1 Tax=Zinderia insecticola (strain CARI) TaxID=871271 RepID=E0TJ36_ZINIC|nr:putative 50S ribosomal subunit protein L5 [Candidatus Zinderia insecticola CARI]
MSRLEKLYKKKIIFNIIKNRSLNCIMQVPKIIKIILSIRISSNENNKINIEKVFKNLKKISNQKPILIKTKKSISNFKIKKNQIVGIKVTLRKKNMYNFLDKLISLVLPRVRDFRGISYKSFDKNGNINIGIEEQIIFPEINYEDLTNNKGMNINIVINSNNIEISKLLLLNFKFPII